jgi:hypothetical protein
MANGQTGQGIANTSNSNANSLYSTLNPMLTTEATNPTASPGFNAMNTASQQSLGGSTAGAVGSLNQAAARSRNKGGFQISADNAVRTGGKQLSQNAASIVGDVQQEGQKGLQSLYGQNLNQTIAGLTGSNMAFADENSSHPGQQLFHTLFPNGFQKMMDPPPIPADGG